MRKLLSGNAWLAAAVSWVIATLLVACGYLVWLNLNGEPFRWEMVRDAALMAAPLALFRAWRDSSRKKAE